MEKAADNSPPLRPGEKGDGVLFLQAALVHLGYPLNPSTKSGVVCDGIFSEETRRSLVKYQTHQHLNPDGVAGRLTVTRLDSMLPAAAPPATVPPTPSPPPPQDNNLVRFKLGTDDPRIPPDPTGGSGTWNSQPKTVLTIAKYMAVLQILPGAAAVIGLDAALNMTHYLANVGTPITIDLERMIHDVPSAKQLFDYEVSSIQSYAQELPPGTHDITAVELSHGYNTSWESKNWYYAVAGYAVWAKGRATIGGSGPGHDCRLDLEYKLFDYYNWDSGKRAEVMGVMIEDHTIGEFHRQGLAKEYHMHGLVRRTLQWKAP